jgi:hypothetical protein
MTLDEGATPPAVPSSDDRGGFAFDAFASYSTAADYQLVRELEVFLESFHRLATPDELTLHKLQICVDGSDFSLAQLRRQAWLAGTEGNVDEEEETMRLVAAQLARCRRLLVFCPGRELEGAWTDRETERFLFDRTPEDVYVVVTHGRAPWERPEAFFPDSIVREGLHRKIWYDLRGYYARQSKVWEKVRDYDDERTRLAADLSGRPAGEILPLWYRQERRRERARRIALSVVAAVMSIAALVILLLWWVSEVRRTQAEDNLAVSILRPLGHDQFHSSYSVIKATDLSFYELDGLWDLATTESERVRETFFSKALGSEQTSGQLFNQSQLTTQSTVGLDEQRRAKVQGILARTLSNPGASLASRLACVEVGRELAPQDAAFCNSALATIIEASRDQSFVMNGRVLAAAEYYADRLASHRGPFGCEAAAADTLSAIDRTAPATLDAAQAFSLQVTWEILFRLRGRTSTDRLLDAANVTRRIYSDRTAIENEGSRVSWAFATAVASLAEIVPLEAVRSLPDRAWDSTFRERLSERLTETGSNLSPFASGLFGLLAGNLPDPKRLALTAVLVDCPIPVPVGCEASARNLFLGLLEEEEYPPTIDRLVRRLIPLVKHDQPARRRILARILKRVEQDSDPWRVESLYKSLFLFGQELTPHDLDQAGHRLAIVFRDVKPIEDLEKLAECASFFDGRLPAPDAKAILDHLSAICKPWTRPDSIELWSSLETAERAVRSFRFVPGGERTATYSLIRNKLIRDVLQFAPGLDREAHGFRERDDIGMTVVTLHRLAATLSLFDLGAAPSRDELTKALVAILGRDWLAEDRAKVVTTLRQLAIGQEGEVAALMFQSVIDVGSGSRKEAEPLSPRNVLEAARRLFDNGTARPAAIETAKLILAEMSRCQGSRISDDLSVGMARFAEFLNGVDADRAKLLLITAISRARNVEDLSVLLRGLAELRGVLAGPDIPAVFDVVVKATQRAAVPARCAKITDSLLPMATRFRLADLAELMKQPTCVGEFRSSVLRLLETKAGRVFPGGKWDFVNVAPQLGLGRPSLSKAPQLRIKRQELLTFEEWPRQA